VQVARLDQPLGVAVRSGDPTLYIVSKAGKVWTLHAGRVDPTPALDLSSQISRRSEQGLLGLAFSPDGRFGYVNYTDVNGNTNVVEYAWRNGRANVSTRRLVLFVRQPYQNHNGGNLAFGPDGNLYIGLGDGGSDANFGPDPHENGQNLGVLLAKMLRIQPRSSDGKPYGLASGNPFAGRRGARPEIWAYGLRNPWRYSFDRQTGDLWIADVGGGAEEEVDFQQAGSGGGQNYGWSRLEGTRILENPPPPPPNAVPPVYEYNHMAGGCAITGGYVYRGSALPDLRGWYVFGDFCLGVINALRLTGGQPDVERLGPTVQQLSSFGQDQQGELYALSLAGGVYQLQR
jgi:glucose/arabinose dehydrogenase